MEIAVLLHNVRSSYNVGSIFRTADAAGVSHIFLSGYTPRPIDRFGRPQKEIAKTALGAEKSVQWNYEIMPNACIDRLKREGWQVVGVEQDERSVEYRSLKMKKPTLFIFGNEVRGISKELREKCDLLVEIPMRGAMIREAGHPTHSGRGKESLNVSVAAGIILFNICERPSM